jgi:hypothetical protein
MDTNEKHATGRLALKTRDDCDYPTLLIGADGVVADTLRFVFTDGGPDGVKAGRERAEKNRDNARRLAACWNAFDGVPTEEVEEFNVENYIIEQGSALGRLEAQRDQLYEALKLARTRLDAIDAMVDATLIRKVNAEKESIDQLLAKVEQERAA